MQLFSLEIMSNQEISVQLRYIISKSHLSVMQPTKIRADLRRSYAGKYTVHGKCVISTEKYWCNLTIEEYRKGHIDLVMTKFINRLAWVTLQCLDCIRELPLLFWIHHRGSCRWSVPLVSFLSPSGWISLVCIRRVYIDVFANDSKAVLLGEVTAFAELPFYGLFSLVGLEYRA